MPHWNLTKNKCPEGHSLRIPKKLFASKNCFVYICFFSCHLPDLNDTSLSWLVWGSTKLEPATLSKNRLQQALEKLLLQSTSGRLLLVFAIVIAKLTQSPKFCNKRKDWTYVFTGKTDNNLTGLQPVLQASSWFSRQSGVGFGPYGNFSNAILTVSIDYYRVSSNGDTQIHLKKNKTKKKHNKCAYSRWKTNIFVWLALQRWNLWLTLARRNTNFQLWVCFWRQNSSFYGANFTRV